MFYHVIERPDFVCANSADELRGIELARIMLDPRLLDGQVIGSRKARLSVDEAVERIELAVESKETKRGEPDWGLSDETVLVLEVIGLPSDLLANYLNEYFGKSEFAEHGFKEIRIANRYPRWIHVEHSQGRTPGLRCGLEYLSRGRSRRYHLRISSRYS